jgi:hypothetical protein
VDGDAVNRARLATVRMTQRAAWVVPAVSAAAVTGYLAWGAWVSAHDPSWLTADNAWWRLWLRPGEYPAQFVLAGLWLAALLCYWYPRRLHQRVAGLTTVVTMVLIGGVLTAAAIIPCRGGASDSSVAGLLLAAYTGNLPPYPVHGCPAPAPLALQIGGVICIAATLTGALAAATMLWRQPLDRLRARVVRDAIIVTGLDTMTMPLLERLAETGRPASIVVIEPDRNHPLLDEARAIGARVMIGPPSSPRVLKPIIAGWRGCALRRLYALRGDVTENEAILASAKTILGRYQPDPDRQPHLVARIDDPRHADHWRGKHVGRSSAWFEDALSCHETTASALLDHVFKRPARQLLLCGDSTLALAILRELARRAWERQELATSADRGSNGQAASNGAGQYHPAADLAPASNGAGPPPLQRVLLLDRRANDLRREYLATSPAPLVQALCEVAAEPCAWQDELLTLLDSTPAADAAGIVVVVADPPSERGEHEAGRAARLHPEIPVFLLTSDGAGTTGAIFDLLHPFQRALLVDGEVPEDSWIRVARHWHECYRLSHPPDAADPRTVTGRPWADLDEFIRQDNILQLRSIMTAVVRRGRRWVPGRAVAPGSFIELNEHDLMAIARAEHTRWFQRRVAAGWSAGDASPNGSASHLGAVGRRAGARARVNRRVMPWTALPAADRAAAVEYLRSQLAQLEDAGFMPAVPAGGPKEAVQFQRIGTVRARRLNARRLWTRRSGEHLAGNPGDWRVLDDAGDERTVRDQEFRSSHEPLGGEVWRRTGTYRAWQVREHFILRTMEGKAIARPGDWVVEGFRGERWPVADDQFQRTYRVVPEHEHE